jgi:hypothetical protein
MMYKLLKTEWPEARLRSGFEAVSLSLQIRAERVTLGQFAALARFMGSA